MLTQFLEFVHECSGKKCNDSSDKIENYMYFNIDSVRNFYLPLIDVTGLS